MVKEDILGGIINAVSRGSSLKDAMQSFYNAGYPKEEIEEAARQFQIINSGKPTQQIQKTTPQQTQTQQTPTPQPQQNIISLENKKPDKVGWLIFFIVLLVIIIGIGVALFIFKDKIISIINNSA